MFFHGVRCRWIGLSKILIASTWKGHGQPLLLPPIYNNGTQKLIKIIAHIKTVEVNKIQLNIYTRHINIIVEEWTNYPIYLIFRWLTAGSLIHDGKNSSDGWLTHEKSSCGRVIYYVCEYVKSFFLSFETFVKQCAQIYSVI